MNVTGISAFLSPVKRQRALQGGSDAPMLPFKTLETVQPDRKHIRHGLVRKIPNAKKKNLIRKQLFKNVVKPEPICVPGIGFQFHTSSTKEDILSENKNW